MTLSSNREGFFKQFFIVEGKVRRYAGKATQVPIFPCPHFVSHEEHIISTEPGTETSYKVPTGANHIDVHGLYINWNMPRSLNGIHRENDSVFVAKLANGLKIGAMPGKELDRTYGDEARVFVGIGTE